MPDSYCTDWRTLRRGDQVRVLNALVGGESGVVTRIEPCKAADSAWAYVENGGSIEEMVLLIDGHSPKLELMNQRADPYETGARVSSARYETRALDIQRRRESALHKLWWCLLLARRGLGLRPLRRRVVPGARQPLRATVRRHSDGRGFTVDAAHPESGFWRVELLSARWGRRGRGIHPRWEGIRKVADA